MTLAAVLTLKRGKRRPIVVSASGRSVVI